MARGEQSALSVLKVTPKLFGLCVFGGNNVLSPQQFGYFGYELSDEGRMMERCKPEGINQVLEKFPPLRKELEYAGSIKMFTGPDQDRWR